MILRGLSKKGSYYDSVTLMIVSKRINELDGVIDSSVVMGTAENKAILNSAGLLIQEFSSCNDTDLLISIKASSIQAAELAITRVDEILKDIVGKQQKQTGVLAYSIEQAIQQLQGANLALISVAGKYAALEAKKALENNLHVMLFSDNVSIKHELSLKKFAQGKGLLLMGPDCGTAIINGVPLAFANVISRGSIGIVAASGTGLQEISCVISNNGAGISQAIGTGGRDIKKAIGGIMFIEALRALENDKNTSTIVLVSKPPHPDVLRKISDEIRRVTKPVVGMFIGADYEEVKAAGAIPASSLEEAALMATHLARGEDVEKAMEMIAQRNDSIKELAKKLSEKAQGRYIRGLFSGGTLCDEAQLVLQKYFDNVFSNTPLTEGSKLKDSWKSIQHTIIDLGDDEFTSGRPHPMIDFSLRAKRIVEEANDEEVAIILFDLVLGYGSHQDPASEIIPAIAKARAASPKLIFICSVTGTSGDPQNRDNVVETLVNEGVFVMPSNYAAAQLSAYIIQLIKK